MKLLTTILTATLGLAACTGPTQTTRHQVNQDSLLRQKIDSIAATAKGKVGVAILNLDTRDTLTLMDTARFPMQSLFKFPIAMAVLKQVDDGKLGLYQEVRIDKKWMKDTATWSPLRDSFPKGNAPQTIALLLQKMVSQSDNIACDYLIDLAGGEPVINDYIHSLGVKNMDIVASEAKMAMAWDVQFANWANPSAINELLEIMHKGSALSKTSNDFLTKIMLETTTGPKRLRGQLPAEIPVAHKTGTSGKLDGLSAATNDAGIIYLPNGQHLAISVFVSMTKEAEDVREGVIAGIAKAAYDAALAKSDSVKKQ